MSSPICYRFHRIFRRHSSYSFCSRFPDRGYLCRVLLLSRSITGIEMNKIIQKSSGLPSVSEQTASGRIRKNGSLRLGLPIIVLAAFLLLWYLLTITKLFPAYALPTPRAVWKSFLEEIREGRLVNDVIASLWRVAIGFVLSAILGIPAGLWLGQHLRARQAFCSHVEFFQVPFSFGLDTFCHTLVSHWRQAGNIPDIHGIFFPTCTRYYICGSHDTQHLFPRSEGLSF